MTKTYLYSLVILASAWLAAPSPVAASTISDGTFANWSFQTWGQGQALATVEQCNDPWCLAIWTNSGRWPADGTESAGVSALDLNYSTTAALSGAFTLSLDVDAGENDGGQFIGLLVEQGGYLYGEGLGVTGAPNGWTTITVGGTFSANSFGAFSGTGPAAPDFSGGIETFFGFYAGNQTSGSLTQLYDNFALTSDTLSSAPEPATFAMIAAGLATLAIRARKRLT